MAILSKGTDFGPTEQVTSGKLDNLVDAATFVTGASGTCVAGGGLEVTDPGGQLQIQDASVTATKTNFLNSGTGVITLSGSAPAVLTSSGTLLMTVNSTNRVEIGDAVATDAGGNGSQAGIKVVNDIYATGDISADGDVAASVSSDKRLKDNIKVIENPTEKLNKLSGNTFTWNDKASYEGEDIGVIAQEVKEIIPSAVKEKEDGYYKVDYTKIVPLLIESIKELNAKVKELEDASSK
jgi:hypothetical protein